MRLTALQFSAGQYSPARWYIPVGWPLELRMGSSRHKSTTLSAVWTVHSWVGSSPSKNHPVVVVSPRGSIWQYSVAICPLYGHRPLTCVRPLGRAKSLFSSPSWRGSMTFFHSPGAGLPLETMRSCWS